MSILKKLLLTIAAVAIAATTYWGNYTPLAVAEDATPAVQTPPSAPAMTPSQKRQALKQAVKAGIEQNNIQVPAGATQWQPGTSGGASTMALPAPGTVYPPG